jgi:hypothetical protein
MSNTITFGKYKGKTVEEVKTEDINWLIWVSKNYNVYSFSSPNPYARLKQSTITERQTFLSEVKNTVEEYFKSLAEKNRETSNSEYVGKIKEKFHRTLTVVGVSQNYDYAIVKAETVDGNRIHFYDKGFNLEVGQSIDAKGTITKHADIVGVQVTYINRVKIQINEQNKING